MSRYCSPWHSLAFVICSASLVGPIGCTTGHPTPEWEVFSGEAANGTSVSAVTITAQYGDGVYVYEFAPEWRVSTKSDTEVVIAPGASLNPLSYSVVVRDHKGELSELPLHRTYRGRERPRGPAKEGGE
jgi:hypothetical protein